MNCSLHLSGKKTEMMELKNISDSTPLSIDFHYNYDLDFFEETFHLPIHKNLIEVKLQMELLLKIHSILSIKMITTLIICISIIENINQLYQVIKEMTNLKSLILYNQNEEERINLKDLNFGQLNNPEDKIYW